MEQRVTPYIGRMIGVRYASNNGYEGVIAADRLFSDGSFCSSA